MLQCKGLQRAGHNCVNNITCMGAFLVAQTIKRRRQWHPTPVLLPGKSHGRRSLVGCSPWGCYKSNMTERLHFHSSISYIGEGNGNPLQNSCLENPRDGGAWWAAVYGVTQSRTRLKQLSSSSSRKFFHLWHLVWFSQYSYSDSLRLSANATSSLKPPLLTPFPRHFWCSLCPPFMDLIASFSTFKIKADFR